MKIRIGDELLLEHLRVRIRLDIRGERHLGPLFIGGKTREQVAESLREKQVAMLRNVPLQGVVLEDVDYSLEVYSVDELVGRRQQEIAYAPVLLTLRVENIEDLLPMLLKPEFRKIEILSPDTVSIHRLDLERLFFNLSQAYQQEIRVLEQKYSR